MSYAPVFYRPFNPIGSQLSGMVRHGRSRAYKRSIVDALPEPAQEMVKRMRYSRTRRRPRRSRYRRGVIRKRIPRALTTNTKLIKVRAVNYVPYANTGVLGNYTVQLNSCDDPFTTGGTGQPLGYDQWKTLYRYAYVVGSKVTLKFHNAGSAAVMIGITPMKTPQGTTALTNYEHYMEYPGTKSRILSQDVDHCVVSHSVSVKKHMSITKIRDNDDFRIDLVNEVQPTKIAYWHVWSQALDETGTQDVDGVITVEYMVLLTDPIAPSRSVET